MPDFGTTRRNGRDQSGKYGRISTSSPPPEETGSSSNVHHATQERLSRHLEAFHSNKRKEVLVMALGFVGTLVFLYWIVGLV